MSEQELEVQELDEFKADGENSEVADPTPVKAKKRKADSNVAPEAAGTVPSEEKGSGPKKVARKADKSMGEHIEDIFSGEELTEEFKEKAAVIFETVVNEKVSSEVARLEEEFSSKLDEQVEVATKDLTEKVDTYLDYVVETWMKDNEVGIESSLRADITESFIDGLKTLFNEHQISIPEESVDLVGEMSEKIEELEKKLNEQVDETIELKKRLESADKSDIFEQVSQGLAETQVEKLRSLVEGLEYNDLEDYKRKIEIVKENYFTKTAEVITENKDDLDPVDEQSTQYVDPAVARYAASITKTFKNIR